MQAGPLTTCFKTEINMETPRFVGIDVAKGELVVAALPGEERWTVENDEEGVRALVERLKPERVALIVLEATGGYELRARVGKCFAPGGSGKSSPGS
jgi:hypothetical protein